MIARGMVAGAAALGLALALGGCGGGSGRDDGPGGRPSFADRLELLPASVTGERGHLVLVMMADLDRAAGFAGATRPDDVADGDAVLAYLNALAGIGPVDGPVPQVAAPPPVPAALVGDRTAEFAAEVGWSLLDVDWYVEHPTPPRALTVMGGSFDERRLTAAAGPPAAGVWRLGEPDGARGEPTVARRAGLPLYQALDSGRLLVAGNPDVIDDARGGGDTLAGVPGLVEVARAVDRAGAYAVMLSGGDNRAVPEPPLPPEVADEVYLLGPFHAVATGLAHDGGPQLVLAYAHADPAAAAHNAQALRELLTEGRALSRGGQPWSDLVTGVDVQVDGTTVVARAALREEAHPRLAFQLLPARDPVVAHR